MFLHLRKAIHVPGPRLQLYDYERKRVGKNYKEGKRLVIIPSDGDECLVKSSHAYEHMRCKRAVKYTICAHLHWLPPHTRLSPCVGSQICKLNRMGVPFALFCISHSFIITAFACQSSFVHELCVAIHEDRVDITILDFAFTVFENVSPVTSD